MVDVLAIVGDQPGDVSSLSKLTHLDEVEIRRLSKEKKLQCGHCRMRAIYRRESRRKKDGSVTKRRHYAHFNDGDSHRCTTARTEAVAHSTNATAGNDSSSDSSGSRPADSDGGPLSPTARQLGVCDNASVLQLRATIAAKIGGLRHHAMDQLNERKPHGARFFRSWCTAAGRLSLCRRHQVTAAFAGFVVRAALRGEDGALRCVLADRDTAAEEGVPVTMEVASDLAMATLLVACGESERAAARSAVATQQWFQALGGSAPQSLVFHLTGHDHGGGSVQSVVRVVAAA
jgi:hypothetical protein